MIVAVWEGASILIDGDRVIANDETVQKVVESLLAEPALKASSVVLEDGGIVEDQITVKPGQPGHARAALSRLAGIRFEIDDGDDIEAPDAE
jgi:hypothetical protein